MDPMENLSQHLVHNHNDMEDLINLGNANRTTASTGKNGTSSCSHGIFTIRFTQVLELIKEWTSKCGDTRSILQEETVALKKKGSGVLLGCQLPHLIGIDEDMLSGGIALYYLKEGRTLIGSEEASCSQGIVLRGPGLLSEHCVLENRAGPVTLIPRDGALCSVHGSVVTEPCQLTQGDITKARRWNFTPV